MVVDNLFVPSSNNVRNTQYQYCSGSTDLDFQQLCCVFHIGGNPICLL